MGSRSSMLCALGKMFQEKASAFGNVIVPEMLKALPMGFAYEVARWFHKRFQGKCSALEARKMLRLPSSRNQTRSGKYGSKGTERLRRCQCLRRGARQRWYHSCRKRTIQWSATNLTVGAERGLNSEHLQLTVTHLLRNKCRKWQGNN